MMFAPNSYNPDRRVRPFSLCALIVVSIVMQSGYVAWYDPLTFTPDGDRLIADGVIDGRALEDFRIALQENPDVQTLVLRHVPGSADDYANLQLGRIVNAMGLETVVPDGGLVASGGTDLFLAGTTRRIEGDACVGVHAWADTDYGSARNAPEDAPVHRTYLRYYEDIDIAPAFYWYTLEAADAQEMHWMSPAEQERFKMATIPSSTRRDYDPAQCDAREQFYSNKGTTT